MSIDSSGDCWDLPSPWIKEFVRGKILRLQTQTVCSATYQMVLTNGALKFPVPQFPHLLHENENISHILGVMWGLSNTWSNGKSAWHTWQIFRNGLPLSSSPSSSAQYRTSFHRCQVCGRQWFGISNYTSLLAFSKTSLLTTSPSMRGKNQKRDICALQSDVTLDHQLKRSAFFFIPKMYK